MEADKCGAFHPFFSFPGSAWERKGCTTPHLQEQPQVEPAKQGVPGQSPGTRVGLPFNKLKTGPSTSPQMRLRSGRTDCGHYRSVDYRSS
jgi:hypothetical protein